MSEKFCQESLRVSESDTAAAIIQTAFDETNFLATQNGTSCEILLANAPDDLDRAAHGANVLVPAVMTKPTLPARGLDDLNRKLWPDAILRSHVAPRLNAFPDSTGKRIRTVVPADGFD